MEIFDDLSLNVGSCVLAMNRLSEREYGMKRSLVRMKRVEDEMSRLLGELEEESRMARYWRGEMGSGSGSDGRRARETSLGAERDEVEVSVGRLVEQKERTVRMERVVGDKMGRLRGFQGIPAVSKENEMNLVIDLVRAESDTRPT